MWWQAARPKTLTAAIVPVVLATSLAHFLGFEPSWWIPFCALLASLAIQIATNLFNDALDFVKGTDNEQRIGPKRITQAGLATPKQVLRAAVFCLVGATLLSIPLILHGGLPILFIGLVSLFMGYAYTSGPFPLSYKGVGEIFVILFFGVLAVSGVVFLITGQWWLEAFIAGLQVGLHCTVLLAINNLRDVNGDRVSQKLTFPVRFGVAAAKIEIAFLLFFPFFLQLYWLGRSNWMVALLPFLALPKAVQLISKLWGATPSKIYNSFLADAALIHLLFSLWLAGALWWNTPSIMLPIP